MNSSKYLKTFLRKFSFLNILRFSFKLIIFSNMKSNFDDFYTYCKNLKTLEQKTIENFLNIKCKYKKLLKKIELFIPRYQ